MIDHEKIEQAVRLMLEGIGEDVNREGLEDTPARIARMYEEVASSRISTGGSAMAALAIASSCLCPWDSSSPSPLKWVSYPFGSILMKPSA